MTLKKGDMLRMVLWRNGTERRLVDIGIYGNDFSMNAARGCGYPGAARTGRRQAHTGAGCGSVFRRSRI